MSDFFNTKNNLVKEKKNVRFQQNIEKNDENIKIMKIQEIDNDIRELEKRIIYKEKSKNTIPEIIFIIPYRDRKEQKIFFETYIKIILEDVEKYELYFVHQCDKRPFNRGAMKNIGFLAIKEKYKQNYKSMTFVFHDIDTIPHKKNLFDYKTKEGEIKHFYGFFNTLGGIVSINGNDFEKINGYINNWGWGYEDNNLQIKALSNKIKIVRDPFFKLGDNNIIHLFDNVKKHISKFEQTSKQIHNNIDGINKITGLEFSFKNEFINVYAFDTLYAIPKLDLVNMNDEKNKGNKLKMFM